MGCFYHSFPSYAPVFICCAIIVLSPHGAMLPPAVQPAEDRWSVSYVTGDLFSCPRDEALAHCISEDCRMGAGIAVMFKKKFKGVEELKEQSESALLLKINQEWSVLFLGASISLAILGSCCSAQRSSSQNTGCYSTQYPTSILYQLILKLDNHPITWQYSWCIILYTFIQNAFPHVCLLW